MNREQPFFPEIAPLGVWPRPGRLESLRSVLLGGWLTTLMGLAVSEGLAQKPSAALPPLAPPHAELPPTFWESHGTAVLISGGAGLVLVAVALWLLLRRRPRPTERPEVITRAALAMLAGEAENGKTLSEVSQILRRYVVLAFGLPAGEMTSAEFYAALAACQRVDVNLGEALSAFLRECDRRKFSGAAADAPMQAAARALELVSQIEKQSGRVAVQDKA
jgi:hypothetical protein